MASKQRDSLGSISPEQVPEASQEHRSSQNEKQAKVRIPRLKRLWRKLDLDVGTVFMMAKAALPPIIGLAMYQSSAVAETYTDLGYLIGIVGILSVCILPRAKFLSVMLLNIIGICIGVAVDLLALYTAVKAREHTTPPNADPSTTLYNSSSSAVCAVWLFVNIWLSNAIRAARPQLAMPVIFYSIFTCVAFTNGPRLMTMDSVISFQKSLLAAFLTGMAIATGVCLLILPITSRMIVFSESKNLIEALQAILKAQSAFFTSLKSHDSLRVHSRSQSEDSVKEEAQKTQGTLGSGVEDKVEDLLKSAKKAAEVHGKLQAELGFAKCEMAYGNLDANDIKEMGDLFQKLVFNAVSIGTMPGVIEQMGQIRKSNLSAFGHKKGVGQRNLLLGGHSFDFDSAVVSVTQATGDALLHVGIRLKLIDTEKKAGKRKNKHSDVEGIAQADVEAKGDEVKPGDSKFVESFELKVNEFNAIKVPANRRVDVVTAQASETGDRNDLTMNSESISNRSQLHVMLYTKQLIQATAEAVLELARFADRKHEDGTMSKKRLISLGSDRARKWLLGLLTRRQNNPVEEISAVPQSAAPDVYIGALQGQKDPEHLPLSGPWERVGDKVRKIPYTLGSTESLFGFRVATATMSIGILAYLRPTQVFFADQRLTWCEFMIAIGMSLTTGSSLLGVLGRLAGTVIAMVLSIIIYYIVDGKTPGILVFLWFFTFLEYYLFIKMPKLTALGLITMITQILIVGYDLQVRKLGVQAADASGQKYYPIYILAPYRLACVAGGSVIAFVWTIFPKPITARSQLRKGVGNSLSLLANLYSSVHATAKLRLQDIEGDAKHMDSPGQRLAKQRRKLILKQFELLKELQAHLEFTKWEPSLGGKFPEKEYKAILESMRSITYLLALGAQATQSLRIPDASTFNQELLEFFEKDDSSSHKLISLLFLLSASIRTGNPLPPGTSASLKAASEVNYLEQGNTLDSYVAEPAYASFAVIQVASLLINAEMRRLTSHVLQLVGEIDFSLHIVSPEGEEK